VIAAGLAFLRYGWRWGVGPPVLNGNLVGGLLVATAGLVAARQLGLATGRNARIEVPAGCVLIAWSVVWWAVSVACEIFEHVPPPHQPAAMAVAQAGSALLLAAVARAQDWQPARSAAFVAVPLLYFAGLAQWLGRDPPSAGSGWIGWPVALAALFGLLRWNDATNPRLAKFAHPAAVALVALLVVMEVGRRVSILVPGPVWGEAAAALMPGLLLLAILALAARHAWPTTGHPRAYAIGAALVLLLLQAGLIARLNLGTDGDPQPLPYLPLANPVDLASAFALLCGWHWLRQRTRSRPLGPAILGGIAFVVSTVALLRATHHLGGVPWRAGPLLESVLVQATLSIWWSLLAFAGMVAGARTLRRWLWLTGAALMAVVVAKLFVVDLGNTGTIARIVSFVGVGALLLIVGYLAPVPPRQREPAGA